MALLKQSTAYTRMFLLVQTADHITGLTGASPTVTLSKAGGAFAAAGGTVTEVSSGWYKIALTTTDTNTLGELAFHVTAASGDPTDFADQVAANILGDTLPANTTQLAGQTVTAAAGVTFPTSVASPTNITAGTITTATNLTNAPTSGDFTAAMKTSLNAATPASVTGSVGSVTGNVGGNVVGSVGSVTGNVGGNVVGSVASVTGNVGGNVVGSVASVTAAVTVSGTSPLTETYPALGGSLTIASALYNIVQELGERGIVGTTVTVKKRDRSTTAKTYTLDSATNPTSSTEAS